MRGSSPALALVAPPRVRIVPRPRPRNALPPPPVATPLATSAPDPDAEPFDLAPRPMLRSVDLEVIDDAGRAPRSSLPPPLPSRAHSVRAPMRTPPTSRPGVLDAIVAMLDDLRFFETNVQAAAFGLVAAMKAVPSLAGMALLRDESHDASQDGGGGYIVVYARGATPGALELVRSRVPEDDPAIGAALVRGGPVTLEYGEGRTPPWRHTAFGDPWTSVVVPVQDEAARTPPTAAPSTTPRARPWRRSPGGWWSSAAATRTARARAA